jgi:hypothetical protein
MASLGQAVRAAAKIAGKKLTRLVSAEWCSVDARRVQEVVPVEFVLSHPFAQKSGERMGHGKFLFKQSKT